MTSNVFTKTTAELDAMAKMSAQETRFGQTFSTAVLMSATIFWPCIPSFPGAFCSLSMLSSIESSNRTDPSQP